MKGININSLPTKVLEFISYYFNTKHVQNPANQNQTSTLH